MKFLLIEHNVRTASRIKRILEDEGYSCLIASDGIQGRKMVLKTSWDFIILNRTLPQLTGVELCSNIRNQNNEVPIIMLTDVKHRNKMAEGFEAGADDCLLLPVDAYELLTRITVLMKRKGIETGSRALLTYIDLEMNLDSRIVKRGGIEINLTPREFSLLEYMMRNRGKVLSREEIAQNVWQVATAPKTNFVDVYITYLRRKIDKKFSAKLIHTKHWMGYVFKVDDIAA